MPFIDLPDGRGKLYVPQARHGRRKHHCPNCFACQWCGAERCVACQPVPPLANNPHEPTVPGGCR